MDAPLKPLRLLLELRPALDRHAGIPHQTRLLFRGLTVVENLTVEGLIQSSTHSLAKGLPVSRGWARALTKDKQIDRLARVVIMLEEKFLRSNFTAIVVAVRRLLGGSEKLLRFDPTHFRDFIWRRVFSRTLQVEDFDIVTSAGFRVARSHWTAMHICGLVSRYLGHTIFPRLDTRDFDVMISETPYPAAVSARTLHVVRYHDAIPLLMPHTISDRRNHQAFHYRALRHNVKNGAWFVCPSEATRQDLVSVFPEAEARAVTIHNIVSQEYFDEASAANKVGHVLRARFNAHVYQRLKVPPPEILANSEFDYLLVVSTIEPRKNHLNLLAAWESLRFERFPALKLVLVGSLGWHHQQVLKRFSAWLRKGEAFMLEEVPSSELRRLYKHARVVVCPSIAEGFDLSGVEAMRAGGAVAASDIPVHREIYADAAEYFNPYAVQDIARAITDVIDPTCAPRRANLVSRGAEVSQRYTQDAILPVWERFLTNGAGRRLTRHEFTAALDQAKAVGYAGTTGSEDTALESGCS